MWNWTGFPQVTSDAISWPFPDQFPIFTDFLQHKNKEFWPSREFTWVTQMEKIIVAIIWHKSIMICHFYVPYQLNQGLIYKMSKNYRTRFSYISFWRLRDWATPSWHWQSKFGMRPSYWYQFHFPDFFLTFWWISKFPDPYENLLTFSWLFKIFTFSWLFPDLWEPCWMNLLFLW